MRSRDLFLYKLASNISTGTDELSITIIIVVASYRHLYLHTHAACLLIVIIITSISRDNIVKGHNSSYTNKSRNNLIIIHMHVG